MSNDEGHHGHSHAMNFGARFFIAALLNAAFIGAEVAVGFAANSLALLADASHNFSDVLGLLLAWCAWWLSKRAPSNRFTYGLRSSTILAAMINVLLLFGATVGIAWDAVERLGAQPPVAGAMMMAAAALGIIVNGATAWLFRQGHEDLNIKATFLHLAADAAVSLAVVVAGGVIVATGWRWLDPIAGLALSVVIVWGGWGVLRDALRLVLQGVPRHIDIAKVRAALEALPNVKEVHDLHIWGISTTETALSVHLIVPQKHPGDDFIAAVARTLNDDFGINHATIQIEIGDGAKCVC